jgi:hypothetical protein
VAGAVIIVWKFFDYLSNREQVKADVKKKEAEEKSAGITAIASLTKDIFRSEKRNT